jgi:hypothetical protein
MRHGMTTFVLSAGRFRDVSLALAIGAALAACSVPAISASAGSETSVNLVKAESYAICPDNSMESGLNLIDDTKSWQSFAKSAAQKSPGLNDWKPNFENSRIVLIRLGSKRSAGFGITASDAKSSGDGSSIVLNVVTSKPAAVSFNATVITSPCLIVNLAHAKFKSLTVFDLTESKALGQISQ